ncbi:MAG: helix-turn-helix domain-containing protein [Coriobacteriales bacterium]|jgi:transcriptional regulator with XRE-family HTH domain
MSDLTLALGRRLRSFRVAKGMSQEKLAQKSGLHPTYIGQVERGEKNITVDTLAKIASGLDIELVDVFEYLDPTSDHERSRMAKCYDLMLSRSEKEREILTKIIYMFIEMKDMDEGDNEADEED